ncbi:MAG: COX15/CtaA family protein [Bellilinea sp.]
MTAHRKFSIFAWFLLVYNLMVVAWGAYVRATGSGAGCGAHWPLCNGEIIPIDPQLETIIEYSHRISSGLTLMFVVILFLAARHSFKKGSLVRKGAFFALFFTITEALVGAGLVLFELVAENTSVTRALTMIVHLINTYLLLGAITLTAWWSSKGDTDRLTWPGGRGVVMIVGMIGFLVLGASGAVTALGDTLFPAASLAEGIQQDFSPTAHFLVRLRVLHPVIASLIGLYLLVAAGWLRLKGSPPILIQMTSILIGLFALQLVLGIINLILLAPIWLQMVHLVVSDLVWAALVLTTGFVFARWDGFERLADYGIKVPVE